MTQSPELAGGAGFTFGDHVVAQYLACLLAEAEGPGLDGRIVCRVALEQRDAGEPLDDLIVDGRGRDGSIARLSLQVKRELTISAAATNSDFRDIVRDAWATLDKADFRVGVDRVGAVTGASVNATKFRDAQLLFQLARASAVPADLKVRFEEGGSASKEQGALLEVFRTISEDLGRPTGLDDLHYLLRHFVLIKVDALHEGADANLRTTDLLRQALVPAERERAADLTQRLQNLARVGAGHARSWDVASIRADVATDFRLASLPSLAPDIDRLVAAGRLAAASISDEIGSVAVSRPILHSRVTTELQNHRFVAIRGLPGTGKSALLRQRAEQALAEGPALMVKSDRLPTGGWTAFAAQLGLQGPDPVALLKEIGSIGTPVLFIDGLDRIDKAQRDVIVDLINAIEGSPELGTWRILATLRDAGLEPVRTWLPAFFERGRFGSVEVKSFDDTEAEELASVRPELRHLLFGQPAIRELVRRPFFARILDELGSGGDTPRSEIELLTTWWRRGGFNAEGTDARLRQRTLLQAARERARRADAPIPLNKLDTGLLAAVDQLVADQVLEELGEQQFVRFRHDIYFEWSYAQVLAAAEEKWPDLLREAGEPPLAGRAVELLAQKAFAGEEDAWARQLPALSDSNLRSQWKRVWLLAPVAYPDFPKLSDRFDQVIFADGGPLLRQALVWFQAQRTIPNPNILDGTLGEHLDRDSRLRMADQLGWPDDFAVWVRFLSYLQSRIDLIPLQLLPTLLELYQVWQNALASTPNRLSSEMVENAAAWLAELEARSDFDRYQDKEDRWNKIEGLKEFTEALRSLLLRAARVEPERVANYLKASIPDERRSDSKIYDDVIGFSPILASTHPADLVDLTLRHLRSELPEDHRKRRLEEEERAAACRVELLAKPEAERDRFDDLALSGPMLGYTGPERWDWEHLALERNDRGYFPAAPTYEPFASLFREAPDEALRLVHGLANHAVTAWRQLHSMQPVSGTPIPVVIDFPWGRQNFWGGKREYLWARGLWAPKALASALVSLDCWVLEQAAGDNDADALIRRIVEGNESIAVLGIAINVALATKTVSATTEALVTTQRLWRADIERFAQEPSIRSSSQIGFVRENQRRDAMAVKAANEHPVRGLEIRSLATLHLFSSEQEAAAKVRAAIQNFVNDSAFEYEEEREDEDSIAAYREEARTNAVFGEIENYRLQPAPEHPGYQVLTFENPIAKEPETRERLAEANRHMLAFRLFHWADQSFASKALNADFSIEDALAAARTIDSPDLFDGEDHDPQSSMNRGAVAGVAAALLGFEPDRDPDWAWSVINRAAAMPELGGPLWTAKGLMSWHPSIFAARAYAAALRRSQDDRSLSEALLRLTIHPLDCVAIEAATLLIGLWDIAPDVAWNGLRLGLDLCSIPASEIHVGYSDRPDFASGSRNLKLAGAIAALGGAPAPLPVPPAPWQRDEEGRGRRRRRRRGNSDGESWRRSDGWWDAEKAAKLLDLVPLERVTGEPRFGPKFVDHCRAMLAWTIERTAPVWAPDGRDLPDSTGSFEWVHGFGSLLGDLAGFIDQTTFDHDFMRPICALEDEPAFSLLAPMITRFLCVHVFDAPIASSSTRLVLDRALDRLLAGSELQRGRYRAGELHGWSTPRLARWLMFVGVERTATMACRFANGDWSEIALILPTADRFVRSAGWAPTIMNDFLTLVERARDHYPADAFAEAVLSLLASQPDPTAKWTGTLIPARLAARVQDLSDREAPLPLALGQKFLRILDLLIDNGDRRSAALQLSPAFRDLRL